MDLAQHPQAAKLSIAQSFISEADCHLASRFRTVHIVWDKSYKFELLPELYIRVSELKVIEYSSRSSN